MFAMHSLRKTGIWQRVYRQLGIDHIDITSLIRYNTRSKHKKCKNLQCSNNTLNIQSQIFVPTSKEACIDNFHIRMHSCTRIQNFSTKHLSQDTRLNIQLRMFSAFIIYHSYMHTFFLCLDRLSYRVKKVMPRCSIGYKVFRLPQNKNDEQDNQGNNSIFFCIKT